MLDVVIPFKHSRNKDQELKFVLRSLEKYLPNIGNVFIYGEAPYWPWRELIIVPVKNKSTHYKFRDASMAYKLLAACKDKRVSNDFLYSADDHMVISKDFYLPSGRPEFYHKGKVFDEPGFYAVTQNNTKELLGQEINNFNVHCPRVFNKEKFIKSIGSINWAKQYGYCIHACYAVMNGIEGVETEDTKFRSCPMNIQDIRDKLKGKAFFSFSDNAWKKNLIDVLEECFPNKSKYEK